MRKRWWLWLPPLALAIGVAVAISAGWRDLTTARMQLTTARADMKAAFAARSSLDTAAGRAGAKRLLASAVREVTQADRGLRHSVPVSGLRLIPGLARQRAGALALVRDARTASRLGGELLGQLDRLANLTHFTDDTLPLSGLNDLENELRSTASRLHPLSRSKRGLWGPVGSARDEFNALALEAGRQMTDAANTLDASRTFIGAAGPRRYLVAAENNAEMRDQGMVLSYALVDFSDGRMHVERTGPITELALSRPAPVDAPPGTIALFGDMGPNQLWQSVNATADFAWSGRAMSAMYHQATGEAVDGVIAIDVPGLSELLSVVGPVTVPGIAEPVTASSAARVLLHDLYAESPSGNQAVRKEILSQVAAATVAKVTGGNHDATELGRALGRATAGGHLKLWSSNRAEEEIFERAGVGGGPGVNHADRTFHLAIQNVNATKLDYFVHAQVRAQVLVSPLGTAVVRTRVTIINDAPSNSAPSNQLGGLDNGSPPGVYVTRTQLWGPAGATQLGSVAESGLTATQETVRVEPQHKVYVEFETIIPNAVKNGRLSLRFVPQPRLNPSSLEIDLEPSGWHVTGELRKQVVWDKEILAEWRFSH